MNGVVTFLTENSVQYLATIGRDGKAIFEENQMIKEACRDNPIVKGQYQSADNPIFKVFYLKDVKAVITDFSGNSLKEYTL